MKVLILDLTHGGDILAEEYLERGSDVTCVDIYRNCAEDRKKELLSRGAKVTETAPAGAYRLLVAPAHCPDSFIGEATFEERKTFSQAVSGFISDKRFRIEVTGVKGKTSTCYLLAHIISCAGKSVFLHTSRGQGPVIGGKHEIEKQMSIAPTSLLRLPSGDFDVMIAEVSLGGSGKADIAVITNLAEDYGIAKNTRKASDAKADILTDGVNIVKESELPIWSRYGDRRFRTFSDDAKVEKVPRLGGPMTLSFEYGGERKTAEMGGGCLALQYVPSVDTVLEICRQMEIPLWAVTNGLTSFKGVPGRGEVSRTGGVWHVKDRNPGISHTSIRLTLECLKEMDALDGAVVVIDPVSKKVCDKMDTEAMRAVAAEYGLGMLVTDGNGSVPEIPAGTRMIIEFIKEGFQ
jgi:UDP-N-acetylmuramyl pentapeptide synthase